MNPTPQACPYLDLLCTECGKFSVCGTEELEVRQEVIDVRQNKQNKQIPFELVGASKAVLRSYGFS